MARVLLTGFEPFAGAPANPSWDAIELLAETANFDDELVTRRLPVAFGSAGRRLLEHVTVHTPDVVIAVGVAQGREAITPELVAINYRNAVMPDNSGRQPIGTPVARDAHDAYFSTLPVQGIVDALRADSIPAEISLSAGAFVCNDTFFALQRALHGLDVASGFIHVPATTHMQLGSDVPVLPLEQIARALGIAIDVTVASRASTIAP